MMLIAIWDWLFTRRRWEIINKVSVYKNDDTNNLPIVYELWLKDQFGNIKKKRL